MRFFNSIFLIVMALSFCSASTYAAPCTIYQQNQTTENNEEWTTTFNESSPQCKKYYETAAVEEFIRSQDRIMINMGGGAANYGNQAANLNYLARLRQMGFSGTAVIVYSNEHDAENKNKIFRMLGLSAENKPDYYLDKQQKIELIENNEFNRRIENNEATVPLLGGKINLIFSPYHYANPNEDTEIFFQSCTNSSLQITIKQNNTGQKTLIVPIANFQQAEDYLKNDPAGKKLVSDFPALLKWVDITKTKSANILPIYGWSTSDYPNNLLSMILGARYAQLNGSNDFKKPLLITTFYPINDKILAEITAVLTHNQTTLHSVDLQTGKEKTENIPPQMLQAIQEMGMETSFSVIRIKDPAALQQLAELQPNHIYLLELQPLPKTVFDGLYTNTQDNIWPQVREGASAYTSLIPTGRPHIHCSPSHDYYLDMWEINLDSASPSLKERLTQFDHTICEDSLSNWQTAPIHQMIGQYIIDAQNPSSELSQFFVQLKEIALQSENDRIRFGIFGAMEIVAMQRTTDNSNKRCLDVTIRAKNGVKPRQP